MLCIIFRSKSLALVNAINSTLCFATGPLWGFLFDWIIFSNGPNTFTIVGAILVVMSSLINLY